MKHLTCAAWLAILAVSAGLAGAADLTIRIDGVKSANGHIMVAVYDSAGTFLKRAVKGAVVPAAEGSTTVVFKDLPPAEYGFALYHDANGNGKMDTNPMGIPIEPIAFSNDALGHMGPPSFDSVKFSLPAGGVTTAVTLR
jgi:uncharacterized protein (DUF2141 family)